MHDQTYSHLREFVLTTVILLPGVGYPGSVQPGLTPFPLDPLDPLDPVDPVDPLESSSELLEVIFCAQAWWLSHISRETWVPKLGRRPDVVHRHGG